MLQGSKKLTAKSLAVVGLFAFILQLAQADDPPPVPRKKVKSSSQPKITISKETTWATEPVGQRGFIDYPSASDRSSRRGVTPAKNAVVLLYQATGPALDGILQPGEIFRRLEIEPPPQEGN
ncbi:MAG: hypothetical protein JWM11_1548, partial [Planctomycetaceae bacterium]|nr:hypothetical protein [Planctomycetaceae bacterium]